MSMPRLTPSQSLRLLLDNDARSIRDLRRHGFVLDQSLHAVVIADCARRLLDARQADARIGGNELERRAEENLRSALEGWR